MYKVGMHAFCFLISIKTLFAMNVFACFVFQDENF